MYEEKLEASELFKDKKALYPRRYLEHSAAHCCPFHVFIFMHSYTVWEHYHTKCMSSCLNQCEPALQRRLPGDQQEPQVSETQQRCGREGSAG